MLTDTQERNVRAVAALPEHARFSALILRAADNWKTTVSPGRMEFGVVLPEGETTESGELDTLRNRTFIVHTGRSDGKDGQCCLVGAALLGESHNFRREYCVPAARVFKLTEDEVNALSSSFDSGEANDSYNLPASKCAVAVAHALGFFLPIQQQHGRD